MGDRDEIAVGLVADPGVPTELARGIADELPDQFRARVDQHADWRVHVRSHEVSLGEDGRLPIAEHGEQARVDEGWDLVVFLTDLPRQSRRRPVVAELDTEHGVGLASLPAIGWFRLRPHVRDIVVHLVGVLCRETLRRTGARPAVGHHHVGRGRSRLASPVRQVPARTQDDVDARLELAGTRGRLRLLFGMVRDNRPWRLVPSLSKAIAAASGTAAFGIFYPTIWVLAMNLSTARLLLINVLAVAAMATWIIIHNGLWERARDAADRPKAVLYNAATVLTLTIGVGCMYAVLLAVTLIGSLAVISQGFLSAQVGHPSGFAEYLTLSWLASSMGTVAGALGSSLESENAVRRATYSKRERERRARRRREERRSQEA